MQNISNNNIHKSHSYEKSWDIDLVICVLVVTITPYFIFDAALRNLAGRAFVQIDWLLIIISVLRLIWILCLPQYLCQKYPIKKVFNQYYWLLILVFYTLLITTIQPIILDFHKIGSPLFDSYDFTVKRGVKYLVYLCFSIYFAIVTSRSKKKFDIIIVALASGLCIAEILGLAQAIVFQLAGVDIFPIIRTGVSNNQSFNYISATVAFAGRQFLRINSIAHEPKGLAGLIGFLLILKLYWHQYIISRSLNSRYLIKIDKYMCKTWWISILVIILTFSGSGLISSLPVFLIFSIKNTYKVLSLKIGKRGLIYFYLFLILIFLSIFLLEDRFFNVVSSFLDASLYRRLGDFFNTVNFENLYNSLDAEDGAFFYNLSKQPFIFLHGLGFGGFSNLSFDFVLTQYSRTREISFISPFSRNILIELLFSSGLIGLAMAYKFIVNYITFYTFINSGIHNALLVFLMINFFFRSNEVLFFAAIALMIASLNHIIRHPLMNTK